MPSSSAYRRRWLALDADGWRAVDTDVDGWRDRSSTPELAIPADAARLRYRIGAVCRVDGLAMALHPACAACGILVGVHHAHARLVGRYCARCAA